MNKSPLKSDNRKKIIRIEVDNENFYITSTDKNYYDGTLKTVRLSGDPQKGKKLVRKTTIDSHIKLISNFYISNFYNTKIKNLQLFKLNNEIMNIIPSILILKKHLKKKIGKN